MGDWARGEFGAAGKKPDVDYACLALPIDHPTVTTDGDVILFPTNSDPAVKDAQLRLASLLISPKVQALFNNAKGSMPVRDDVDMSLADPCMLKGLAIIKDPANIAIGAQRWLSNDTTTALDDLIAKFWTDDTMTVADAQKKYADIVKRRELIAGFLNVSGGALQGAARPCRQRPRAGAAPARSSSQSPEGTIDG